MVRRQLDERQWEKIEALLVAERRAGRPPKNDRNFVEAVLWWRRTGVPWRDVPDDFGHGRPCSTGLTDGRRAASGADCFWRCKPIAMMNGTASTARSTAHTSMPPAEKGGAEQGIGRSRGGLSTKVHVVVDALGLPLTFQITEGQRHDNRSAKELVARV